MEGLGEGAAEEGRPPAGEIHVHCGHNPDTVKVFYEIPNSLAELVKAHDQDRTFTECLADIVHPH